MSKIGIQMYTLREFIKDEAGLRDTLQKLAEIGYQSVQITKPSFLTTEQLAELLAEYGLEADSVFCPVTKLEDSLDSISQETKLLQTNVVRTDSIPPEYRRSVSGYRDFAKLMTRQALLLKERGLRYLYHFHAFEFISFGEERGIDILLNETDPEIVMFQPDVFWLAAAGVEPSAFLRNFQGRAFYLHVKDYAIGQLEGSIESVPYLFAPVGQGNLNWLGIMRSAREIGIEQFVVEQDYCAGDVFAAVKASYDNLKKMLS